LIVDAHLDLSYNALRGRDLTVPATAQKPDDDGVPSVGLPDLRAGGVGLICATIFCSPHTDDHPGYRTPDEAHDLARRHLDWYRRTAAAGQLRMVTSAADLHEAPAGLGPAAILLMEGADPIRSPDEATWWFDAGVRIVGLAWRRTRLAGGTGAPGPLTPEGIALVAALDQLGIIHDASHLAEESFRQLLDLSTGPIVASHSNCRSIVPTDRQLSDDMIRAIVQRGGVIGINFYDKFLIPPEQRGRRANLADVVHHIRHMCDVAGSARFVGLGTDMDGGLGRDQIPVEIASSADLPRVAEALSAAGFADGDVRGILANNWLNFFQRHLAG